MSVKSRLSLLVLPALLVPAALSAQAIEVDEAVLTVDSEPEGAASVASTAPATPAAMRDDDGLAERLKGRQDNMPSEWQAAAPRGNVADGTPSLALGLVSSANDDATYAGMQMLQKGGNSIDAAMAVMLALTVTEPQSSGIGGGGFLLHEDARTGTLSSIDGRETAPVAALPSRFLDEAGNPIPFNKAFPGGKSVGVPGNIALMGLAHRKWGKLKWADLFTPAIQLAEGGYTVSPVLAERLQQAAGLWKDFPEAQKLYWIDGRPAREGEELKNEPLAETLARIAAIGPNAFYSGETADSIVRAVRDTSISPGDMTNIDLSAYRAKERPAVCAPYRTYRICGMGPPSSGAITVLQVLKLVERFDLAELGADDATSWHLIGEAMQLAYADRDAYLGDPDFMDIPVEGMVDAKYLADRSKLISPDKSLTAYVAGNPPASEPRQPVPSGDDNGTSHFVTVDREGNVTSMTSTIEGPFGSQLIASGFFLNNELTDFSFAPVRSDGDVVKPVANSVTAGKRPLSSMSPTIVYDENGRAVLAIGSAGGRRIIMHVAKSLIGVIDFGLPLEDAIDLPNIFFDNGTLLVERGRIDEAVLADLADYGQPVEAVSLPSKVNGAQWSEQSGWTGAVDPRNDEGLSLSE